jgi:RNA polymerase sigma-70 factor (ECF subfamily)
MGFGCYFPTLRGAAATGLGRPPSIDAERLQQGDWVNLAAGPVRAVAALDADTDGPVAHAVDATSSCSAAPQALSDEQFFAAHRRGEQAAFAAIVSRYQRELYGYLFRFIGDAPTAEDLFQEAFLRVSQSADRYDSGRRPFRSGLFSIAANAARDVLRSRRAKPICSLRQRVGSQGRGAGDVELVDLLAGEARLEGRELCPRVREKVTAMPEHLREILLLSYFHGFSCLEIAEVLEIPLGTVKSRLHAAVAHFARRRGDSA